MIPWPMVDLEPHIQNLRSFIDGLESRVERKRLYISLLPIIEVARAQLNAEIDPHAPSFDVAELERLATMVSIVALNPDFGMPDEKRNQLRALEAKCRRLADLQKPRTVTVDDYVSQLEAALEERSQFTRQITDTKHIILTMGTSESGLHSGRRRYLLVCTACEQLLHEATTGVKARIEDHIAAHARDGWNP